MIDPFHIHKHSIIHSPFLHKNHLNYYFHKTNKSPITQTNLIQVSSFAKSNSAVRSATSKTLFLYRRVGRGTKTASNLQSKQGDDDDDDGGFNPSRNKSLGEGEKKNLLTDPPRKRRRARVPPRNFQLIRGRKQLTGARCCFSQ